MSGATTQQQNEMFRLAQEINSRNPLTALDIASGERFMAMAGNAPDQIKKMIEPASQLAAIFGMNLGGKGGVADLMTNIMATFNIPGTQATDVVDKLGIATTSTNMSLNDLAAAIQYSGAEFRNAKMDMGTAAAAIGVLGDQGIQASSAGTALANMYRYLTLSITGQRKKGYEALKAIGIEPKSLLDAKGNLKDISTLIKTIGDHLGKDASTQKATSFFYNAVGVRGSRALSGLLQDYWTGRNKLETVMAKYNDPNNADWTNKAMQDYMKSPQGRIDALTSSFENLKVSAGAALADVFNKVDQVMVDYYTPKISGAKQIEITADKFGGNYYLEASTLFRDTNGVDMPAEFIIPNCKIQSNFTFTMASSGDPSTFTFTMDAFPDYTRFDKSKKVLAAIQIIDETTSSDLHRTMTRHDASDEAKIN